LIENLKFQKGITKWNVVNKEGEKITFKDLEKVENTHIPKTVFPPNEEEIKKFNLHYCMRFLPHYQNTGGFFVCVLEKVEEFDDEKEREKIKNKSREERKKRLDEDLNTDNGKYTEDEKKNIIETMKRREEEEKIKTGKKTK
jgi:hypothetical protein